MKEFSPAEIVSMGFNIISQILAQPWGGVVILVFVMAILGAFMGAAETTEDRRGRLQGAAIYWFSVVLLVFGGLMAGPMVLFPIAIQLEKQKVILDLHLFLIVLGISMLAGVHVALVIIDKLRRRWQRRYRAWLRMDKPKPRVFDLDIDVVASELKEFFESFHVEENCWSAKVVKKGRQIEATMDFTKTLQPVSGRFSFGPVGFNFGGSHIPCWVRLSIELFSKGENTEVRLKYKVFARIDRRPCDLVIKETTTAIWRNLEQLHR